MRLKGLLFFAGLLFVDGLQTVQADENNTSPTAPAFVRLAFPIGTIVLSKLVP